jgi:hypothetical protein
LRKLISRVTLHRTFKDLPFLMRTIGPGSIASLLKIALDVAYVVLWVSFVAIILAAAAGLLALPFMATHLDFNGTLNGQKTDAALLLRHWPMLLAAAVAVAAYVGVLLVIFFRLRQVFATLILGDPFRPENVGRLRIVGLGLIALEVAGYIVRLALVWAIPDRENSVDFSVNFSGWFAILVVFVLAEVFREGARLRRDAELTI